MKMDVFISHSKKDGELVGVIDHNFKTVDITPLFMEFTPESKPPYTKIEENLNLSAAIFLFLTQNIKSSDYTQNWISFEVGLAKKSNKPLFVIEDANNKVHFPVPYLTDYILYEQTKIEDWQKIHNVLRKLKENVEKNKLIISLTVGGALVGGLTDKKDGARGMLLGSFTGLVLGGIINALIQSIPVESTRVKCPDCKLEFNFYSRFNDFPCPSCRINLKFGR